MTSHQTAQPDEVIYVACFLPLALLLWGLLSKQLVRRQPVMTDTRRSGRSLRQRAKQDFHFR